MQLSILTSILQPRVRYAAQSRVLCQVQQQQQQQINSARYSYNTATSSFCVLCSRRGIVDYNVIYSSTYRRGLTTSQGPHDRNSSFALINEFFLRGATERNTR